MPNCCITTASFRVIIEVASHPLSPLVHGSFTRLLSQKLIIGWPARLATLTGCAIFPHTVDFRLVVQKNSRMRKISYSSPKCAHAQILGTIFGQPTGNRLYHTPISNGSGYVALLQPAKELISQLKC